MHSLRCFTDTVHSHFLYIQDFLPCVANCHRLGRLHPSISSLYQQPDLTHLHRRQPCCHCKVVSGISIKIDMGRIPTIFFLLNPAVFQVAHPTLKYLTCSRTIDSWPGPSIACTFTRSSPLRLSICGRGWSARQSESPPPHPVLLYVPPHLHLRLRLMLFPLCSVPSTGTCHGRGGTFFWAWRPQVRIFVNSIGVAFT